ncbi:MAG: CHASE sensor domain-containing protein [Candidatus Acidiferrales bacterium]
MLASSVALLVACASFFAYDLITFRESMVRHLSLQAETIGSHSNAALIFNDAPAAELTLFALKSFPHILSVEIYTADGQPFAGFRRDASQPPPLPRTPQGARDVYWFGRNELGLVHPIIFDGAHTGTVYIRSDLRELTARLIRYAIIVLVVLMSSLLAALLVSRTSQRAISTPIMNLAELAQKVSRRENYAMRARPDDRGDEVSVLMHSFNDMLVQIQQRDGGLRDARDKLENRVRERTAELQSAEASLRSLSGKLMQLQDEERRRLARELHDSSGQVLVALAMNLTVIQAEAANLSTAAVKSVEDSQRMVRQITSELRTISHLLHPPLLDEAGLETALKLYVQGFSERSGIRTHLTLSPDLGRLSCEVETALFRIIQECLTNIHRHSGSSEASVSLTRDATEVRLRVSDYGKGMPAKNDTRPGVGIGGMRERIAQLGGQFEISSGVTGTTINAVLPVPPAALHAEPVGLGDSSAPDVNQNLVS